MEEVFRKYPEATPAEERKGSPVCIVSHPDAGGPCQRAAIGEVWSLPFCASHGREAELAAADEMASSLEGIFAGLVAVEQERRDRNEMALRIIKEAAKPPSEAAPSEAADILAHEEAIATAYPPEELEANTDPETLRYDYEQMGMDTPHDWWCEAQIMACRFMRQAHDQGLAGLVRDLEYVRERATVQRLLASRYMDRKYGPARI
jgi:hypothetical protein